MSHPSSSSLSPPKFDSAFNSALDAYKNRTKQALTSHPLLPQLQACDSADAILQVLREHTSASHNADDRLTKWLVPAVNVLYGLSAALGEGVGLVFSPAKVIFAGIGVLLLAAKDVGARQEALIDLFNRIEYFFQRLEIYTGVPATVAMKTIIIDIMVEVISFLAIATKEIKRGKAKQYLKKLMGNTDIEDSLRRLDKLTQEEARMASAELLRITHNVEGRLMRVGEGVQSVEKSVQDIQDTVAEADVRSRGIDHNVQDVSDKVQSVDSKVDQVNRNHVRDSLRTWLSPPNPSTNHNVACEAHHEGTAQWFFRGRIFNQWKSTGSLLWINGKPGSGKSILCSAIIQDVMTLRDCGNSSVAYFYFDFRDADKQRRRNLLHSLLIQLAARSDPCCDILAHLYSVHDRGVQKPSDRAMTECLKEMLTLPEQGPIYIIIDALDECPDTSGIPSPREEMLDFMNELVDLRLPNLRICVTSRPEFDIQAILQPLTPYPVSLHEESGQKQDIIDYVTSVVRADKRMRRWREEDKDLVIKTLSEKADGMFRWVFCQLEVLRRSFPPSVRRILEELPESLDETYERILKEIRKANQRHAYLLLQCLVAAIRPLSVEELSEVLAFDFNVEGIPKLNRDWRWEDQEEAVMSACSSLVTIVKAGDSRIVQFSHFSVKEFLMSNRLAESSRDVSRYHIQLETAHTILAKGCLGVLLRLDDRVDRSSIKSFPLARYAAQYWVKHARFENVSSQIEYEMDCLFDADRRHFAVWLWIYNIEEPYGSLSGTRPSQPDTVPLYYAALFGFRDLAKRLLAKHPEDVNAKCGDRGTPLHASILGGHIDIFSLLIDNFLEVEARNEHGLTALHVASWGGHPEIGQRLLSRGANVDALTNDGRTPLYIAASWGRLEFVRMLLEHQAAINISSKYGVSPLRSAIGGGHVEVVRSLLEHCADPNTRDKWGATPSEDASRRGLGEIVQILSDYGATSLKE